MSLPEEIDLWEVTKQYPIIVSECHVSAQTLPMIGLARNNLFSVATERAEDTLYLCCHYPVSLVISEVFRPGMGGLELIQTLRGDTRTQHLPIIICSAGIGYKDRALELGANDFFIKPFYIRELITRVRQLVAAAYPGLGERHFDHTWQPDTTSTGSYRVQIPDHKWAGQVRCL